MVTVNVAARQLLGEGLDAVVAEALEAGGVAPGRLWLEVTEDAMGEDGAREQQALARLRALGVRVAIDDFGTGFSSLASLRRLPVDLLKIDGAFVAGLDEERADTAVVSSIVDLARRLGLGTVAEGVETERQREELVRLGCELLQGFGLARPVGVAALELLVAAQAGVVR